MRSILLILASSLPLLAAVTPEKYTFTGEYTGQ
jgi:hypothetical protein